MSEIVRPDATGDATAPVGAEAGTATAADPGHSNQKTDAELALSLLAMVETGVHPREAATTLGLNIRTVYRILARSEVNVEATRTTILRLMQREALDRMEDWRTAADVGAKKRGNHGPAKDWLLHAGILDPLDSDTGSVRVAIMIGTDEKPMRIRSPLTIATTTSSGSEDDD